MLARMKKFNHLTITGENVKWYGYCGKQSGSFKKKKKTKLN